MKKMTLIGLSLLALIPLCAQAEYDFSWIGETVKAKVEYKAVLMCVQFNATGLKAFLTRAASFLDISAMGKETTLRWLNATENPTLVQSCLQGAPLLTLKAVADRLKQDPAAAIILVRLAQIFS